MKIRFRKNTIRYRLDQIDVKNLKEKGSCEEKIDIPPGNIIFSLTISEEEGKRILFHYPHLKLEVPSAQITPVLEGSQTGFECQMPGTGDSALKILVERDFKCLVPRGEEDINSFDNPLEGNATC